MKLVCEVTLSASFMHSSSGQILNIDNVIKQEYDEYSVKYKELCKQFENDVGFKREENRNKFDEILLKILSEISIKESNEKIKKLSDVFKQHSKSDAKGYIEFGGWILKLQDYSAVSFKEVKYNISKH